MRRSNGDSWSICPVTAGTVLQLRHFTSLPTGNTLSIGEVPRYLALHIKIDKEQWCPDNLVYEVVCTDTSEKAVEYLANKVCYWVDDDSDYVTRLTTADRDKLQSLTPVGITGEAKIYHHLQILEIGEKELNLNEKYGILCNLFRHHRDESMKSSCHSRKKNLFT